MSDNGLSLEELRALAKSTGAPDSSPSPNLPVERLTNFMDVCTQYFNQQLKLDFSHYLLLMMSAETQGGLMIVSATQ